jgi:hypothetical protein
MNFSKTVYEEFAKASHDLLSNSVKIYAAKVGLPYYNKRYVLSILFILLFTAETLPLSPPINKT